MKTLVGLVWLVAIGAGAWYTYQHFFNKSAGAITGGLLNFSDDEDGGR